MSHCFRLSALLVCGVSLFAAGELSGRRAPGFALPDSSFKIYDLQDYRGKVVLIDFMQTACPPCQVFARTLEQVQAKYGDRVAILSVVTYPPDNQDTVARFIAAYKVTVPVLFDCGQMAASYLKRTPQNSQMIVPHLFVIDGEGMIRNDFTYELISRPIFEGEDLFAEIDKILRAAPVPKKR